MLVIELKYGTKKKKSVYFIELLLLHLKTRILKLRSLLFVFAKRYTINDDQPPAVRMLKNFLRACIIQKLTNITVYQRIANINVELKALLKELTIRND